MPLPQLAAARRSIGATEATDLIERARQGDVAAFERLISDHQRRVYTFALGFVGDPERARDLAQEALVKVYRSLGSFRAQSSFSTWLYSIVKNVYLDAMKSRAGREQSREAPLDAADAAALVDAANAEQQLLDEEQRNLLMRALQQIAPAFRAVVVMADVQGMSYEEIAAALKLPIGTVKSRLARGRDALRVVLFAQKEKHE
jgi:RNA polymerase sigma-70 factor (ECF subfamily)